MLSVLCQGTLKYQEGLLGRFVVIYGFRVPFDFAHVKKSYNSHRMRKNSVTVGTLHFGVMVYLLIRRNRGIEIQLLLEMPEPLRFRIEPPPLRTFHD